MMSGTVVDEPMIENEHADEHRPSRPDLSRLEDHTPEYVRAPKVLAGLVFFIGMVYLLFCIRPVWHTDVWGHLSYGRLIWQSGSIPATEPLMPLAAGMRFVDTAWLSQVIGYLTMSSLGIAGLQGIFALSVALCVGLLAARCYQTTRHGWFSTLAMVGFLVIAWAPLTIIRPQMAGLACFVILLSRLTSRRMSRSDWLFIPALFVAWSNLHGSFLMGLFLLGSFVLGRSIDLLRRTGSWKAVVRDPQLRRNLLLLELAAAAVLVNPYGIGIYAATLQIASNPNLNDLIEWHPLGLNGFHGVVFGAVAVMLAIVYRSSPRRVRSWEVLTLVVLGWAALSSSRMLVWWAPVAALLLAIHGHAVWRQWRRLPLVPEPPVRAGKWTVVVVGLIWIFFAYSPLGVRLVHGKAASTDKAVSSDTPRAVVKYLNEKKPQGQIFNTYEWGDYLQWAGPPGLKVFVNSHAHLVPREVWQAYMQISEAQAGWEDTLDRYGINTIVIDQLNRKALIKRLKESEKWKLDFEQGNVDFEQDGQLVFIRKTPI
jgi:hypothetical protein